MSAKQILSKHSCLIHEGCNAKFIQPPKMQKKNIYNTRYCKRSPPSKSLALMQGFKRWYIYTLIIIQPTIALNLFCLQLLNALPCLYAQFFVNLPVSLILFVVTILCLVHVTLRFMIISIKCVLQLIISSALVLTWMKTMNI